MSRSKHGFIGGLIAAVAAGGFLAAAPAVTISSVVATGDFIQTNNCGKLDSGESCQVNVTFKPTDEGERRGTWIWYSIRPEAVERFSLLAGSIRPGGARPAADLGPASDASRGLPVLQADWRQW